MINRRHLLGGAAGLALVPGAPAWAVPGNIPLGLQLYTVREDLARDYVGTMRRIKAIGIRELQSNLTMNGKSAADQRKLYDDLGFVWESVHAEGAALGQNLQTTIDTARRAGIKNITCSFPLYPASYAKVIAGPSISDWERNAEVLNRCGLICRGAGLSFGYHNHNIEFRKIGNVVPYDLLLKQTDPALVQMEMDIGWVAAAGADPVAYLDKYPRRFHALHVKDLKNSHIPNTRMKMIGAIVGLGIIDWNKIRAAVRKTSVSRAYLELEAPYNPSPLSMVRASFRYLHGKV